jgi:signal transduction histidine kinase
LLILVRDQGPGIAESQLEEVFKPFVRLDEARNTESGSVGLGLAIARSFTELHGGELNIRSGEGQGTNVLVHLPLRDAPNRIAA